MSSIKKDSLSLSLYVCVGGCNVSYVDLKLISLSGLKRSLYEISLNFYLRFWNYIAYVANEDFFTSREYMGRSDSP